MIKAFLLILIILPSYLLSDNTDGGFGSIANDRNEPISFSSNTLSFNQETGTSEMKGSVSIIQGNTCLLYTSPSPRDVEESRMPSSA